VSAGFPGADAGHSARHDDGAAPAQDKRSIAVDLLRDGFVQSFVDFFHLYHDDGDDAEGARAPSLPAAGHPGDGDDIKEPGERAGSVASASRSGEAATEGKAHGAKATVWDMLHVRESLAEAEAATRRHDKTAVMKHYTQLADHFSARHEARTALFFRSKAAEVARLTEDLLEEPKALLALGATELSEGEPHRSVRTLEGCLDLVSEHLRATGVPPSVREQLEAARARTRSLLLKAYAASSAALSEEGNLADSLAAELRSLQVAQEAGAKDAEAAAQLHAGELCVSLGRPAKALPYLKNFMALQAEAERDGKRLPGSDRAFAALSQAYELAGRPEDALTTLEEYAAASERVGDSHSVGEARQRLGVALLLRGDTDDSVAELSQSYDVRRALLGQGAAKRSDLAAARVSLGLARASAAGHNLVAAVASDVPSLLRWKVSRDASALSMDE